MKEDSVSILYYATKERLPASEGGHKVLYLMYQNEFKRHVWLMNPVWEECFLATVEGSGNIVRKVTINGSVDATPLPLFE